MGDINETYSSFDITDYSTAKQVYSVWQAEQSQELDDWLIRQRKAELDALVRKVIKNELSKDDKRLVELRWYKGLNCRTIAEKLNMGRSTVYRRLEKINDILFDKLKYALEYRFGGKNEKTFLLVENDVTETVKEENMLSVGQRICALRNGQKLPFYAVCCKTGIAPERMTDIESYAEDFSVQELKKLSEFYKVSTDYILFGKTRVLRDPLTGMPINCNC